MMTTEEWNDKPTGSSDKRADLSSPLGAVAMREDVYKAARIAYNKTENFPAVFNAIRSIPLPTHAALLAHALKLPEVAALVEALDDMCIIAKQDDWDKSLSGRQLVYRNSCAALAALEAKP